MRNKKPVSVKRKNSTKAKRLITCCLSLILLLSGCHEPQRLGPFFDHPEFKTDYTIEEHIERISAKTKKRFAEKLQSGLLVSYSVDILYAFYDEDPEYFLIELEFDREWEGEYDIPNYGQDLDIPFHYTYKTKYMHTIGFICNDKYYLCLREYGDFIDGQSSYRYYGYAENKKYYGSGVQAVEKDGQIVKLFSDLCIDNGGAGVSAEFHTHYNENDSCCLNEVVPESNYKNLMETYMIGLLGEY